MNISGMQIRIKSRNISCQIVLLLPSRYYDAVRKNKKRKAYMKLFLNTTVFKKTVLFLYQQLS